jgi:putative ATP-binding cassette transporter
MVERLMGFKRALSQKPDGLFLDESTSAADEPTEACFYRQLRERLAVTTAFSVGHQGTLRPFHARHFVAQPNGSGPASIVEVAVVTGC